jgi:hypothetical protein
MDAAFSEYISRLTEVVIGQEGYVSYGLDYEEFHHDDLKELGLLRMVRAPQRLTLGQPAAEGWSIGDIRRRNTLVDKVEDENLRRASAYKAKADAMKLAAEQERVKIAEEQARIEAAKIAEVAWEEAERRKKGLESARRAVGKVQSTPGAAATS